MLDFLRTRNWQNLGSFRALLGSCLIAIIPAGLAGAAIPALGSIVFLAVFAAWMLVVQMSPTTVLYCPECRKRVKAGANRCHHCGITVR